MLAQPVTSGPIRMPRARLEDVNASGHSLPIKCSGILGIKKSEIVVPSFFGSRENIVSNSL